jgi:molybdate transport system substrate-binding protein
MKLILTALVPLVALSLPARAAEVNVAVAANFTQAAKDIAEAFHASTGDDAVLSFGSTGKLYTQIANGAPFKVFLAADQERPAKAETDGLAVAGSRFTYATGKIVLYSTDASVAVADGAALKTPDAVTKIAIANPKTAPYGTAAVEAMKALGVYDGLETKLVQGDSIAQTFQFVESGNAAMGFVALSQVIGTSAGAQWVVPQTLYTPIRQDAVLLKTGEADDTAKAFVAFLKSDKARQIIAHYGYGIDLGQ